MKRSRRKDLLFEIEDYLNNHITTERKFIILNYINLDILNAYIKYIDNWENKVAKALLIEHTATLVGHIGSMKVFAGFEFDKDDYIISTKSRSKKEEVMYGTYITPYVTGV